MTVELTNLPFKHQGLDDNIDMEAIAIQLNAIEPGAGVQETAINFVPQMTGADSGTIFAVIAGLAILSIVFASFMKHKPKLNKIFK